MTLFVVYKACKAFKAVTRISGLKYELEADIFFHDQQSYIYLFI